MCVLWKFLRVKFSQKADFRESFIDIHQAQSKLAIVYMLATETFVKSVQYCGIQTSITSGSGLAHATDSSRLTQKVGSWSLVIV